MESILPADIRTGWLCVNLTQARVTRKEGESSEKNNQVVKKKKCFLFFETELLCIALAVLKFTL